jgi:hypothetical protein
MIARREGTGMKYVCDGRGRKTWFRIETEAEAVQESQLLDHAVEKHFRRHRDHAASTFKPASSVYIEQNIGLASHIQQEMPLFLTLRDHDGTGLATAMLPPRGLDCPGFQTIIVGLGNRDPYPDHGEAIEALGRHFGLTLDRERCYPYRNRDDE